MSNEETLRRLALQVRNWGTWGPEDEIGTLNYIRRRAVGQPRFILCGDCSPSDTTSSPHEIWLPDGGKSAAQVVPTLCRIDRNGGDAAGYLQASRQLFLTRVR